MTSVNVSDITTKSSFLQKQNDDTFNNIVEIFSNTNETETLIKKLESIVSKRFGLKLEIVNAKDTKITEFKVKEETISVSELEKLDKKTIEKDQDNSKRYSGDVDYNKLKVSGDLSDITIKLNFNFGRITTDYSDEEKADIFLFVVGNAFVVLANYHKVKLISKLLSDLDLNDNKKDISALISKFKEINKDITEEDVKSLVDDKGNINKAQLVMFGAKFIKKAAIDLSDISQDSIEFTNSFSNANKELCSNALDGETVINAIIFIFRTCISLYCFYVMILSFYVGGLVMAGGGLLPIAIACIIQGMVYGLIGIIFFPPIKNNDSNSKQNKAKLDSAASKAIGKSNFKIDLFDKVSNIFSSGFSSAKKIFSLEEIANFNIACESLNNTSVLPNLTRNNTALEVIDFQHDDFGTKLEALITIVSTKITDKTYKDVYDIEEEKEVLDITALVEKRLGLKIKLVTDSMLAAIMPFYSNKNHIFLDAFWRGGIDIKDQNKLLKNFQNKEGSVDLAKAKLGGIFSEYVNEVYMNFYVLVNDFKLSPAEITGIFLHELGHGFYVCEYSDRLESVNQVLANVATEVLGKKSKDLNYVYRELEKVNPAITKEEVEVLLSDNRVVAGTKWFQTIIGTVKYQLDVDTYDKNSFEQLADNFASRFGYGRQAIIALDKLYLHMGDPAKSKKTVILMQTLAAISLIGIVALLASLLVTAMPLGLLYSFLFGFMFRMQGEDMKDHTYDELKQRYIRLRNDAVEMLKADKFNKTLAKSILDDIYVMDAVIKETHQWSTIYSGLANLVFGKARKSVASITEQQQLEALLSNDLFVQATRLKLA